MFFILPLPPGINQTYATNKSGHFYKKTKAKDWEEEAGWILKAKRRVNISEKPMVQIHVFYHPNREPDIDAYIKITLDRLEKVGLIENDRHIRKLVVEKFADGRDPRLELTIS